MRWEVANRATPVKNFAASRGSDNPGDGAASSWPAQRGSHHARAGTNFGQSQQVNRSNAAGRSGNAVGCSPLIRQPVALYSPRLLADHHHLTRVLFVIPVFSYSYSAIGGTRTPTRFESLHRVRVRAIAKDLGKDERASPGSSRPSLNDERGLHAILFRSTDGVLGCYCTPVAYGFGDLLDDRVDG